MDPVEGVHNMGQMGKLVLARFHWQPAPLDIVNESMYIPHGCIKVMTHCYSSLGGAAAGWGRCELMVLTHVAFASEERNCKHNERNG